MRNQTRVFAAVLLFAGSIANAQSSNEIVGDDAAPNVDTPMEEAIAPDRHVPDFGKAGYSATDGKALYESLCAGCHMPDGKGAIGAGEYPSLAGNDLLLSASYPIYLIINGQAAMPSLGHLLDDEQILAVTDYIQTNLGNDYETDGTLELVADSRPETDEEMATEEHAIPQESAEPSARRDDAANVVRHGLPNSDFPILQAVEVPADATLVYLSGTVPQVLDDSASEGAPERFGDTAAQTDSTLTSIRSKLEALELGMGDVIKMQVYLVAPDGQDSMDFSGFMEGYTKHFGTDAQPELPTRSVFEVAGLANPDWLVEIEVVAVRP